MEINGQDMLRLAAMLRRSSGPEPEQPEHEAAQPLDPEFLRILRSLLPFLNFSYQKQLGVLLKLMELKYTLAFYQAMPESGDTEVKAEPIRILQSVRGACDPANRGFVDMLLNVCRLRETMRESEAKPGRTQEPPGEEQPGDKLKEGLTPDQQGMLDMLSSMLASAGGA